MNNHKSDSVSMVFITCYSGAKACALARFNETLHAIAGFVGRHNNKEYDNQTGIN